MFHNCTYAANSSAVDTGAKTLKVQTFGQNGKFGLKDQDNNIIVNPEYKKLIKLGTTAWIIQKKNKFGLIDNYGNILIKPKYRHVDRFFGEYVKLGNDKDYGLYNSAGQTIIPPEYTSIDPLFGKMFLTCKKYKYGIVDYNGNILLENEFDDIYMPKSTSIRLQYDGDWYEIEKLSPTEIILPPDVKKVTVNDKDFKVTKLFTDTGVISGYSLLTLTDYSMKIFSSISPAYEETIDELLFSQGAETVSILMKFTWLPQFPFTYAKKYYKNIRTPNNGPLSEVRSELKKQLR